MGLDLSRQDFMGWVTERISKKRLNVFMKKLENHVGKKLEIEKWTVRDEHWLRVGSYTAYGIFILCLVFLTEGDFEKDLESDEDIELEALKSFRNHLDPRSVHIHYANQFLDVGDTDTIFIPHHFERPFKYNDSYVASKYAAEGALESLAITLKFDLNSPPEDEGSKLEWIPMATAKNVARIIYRYFKEEPNACVSYV